MKIHELLARLKKITQKTSKYWGEASFLDWPSDESHLCGGWQGDEFCYSCRSPFKHTDSIEEDTN